MRELSLFTGAGGGILGTHLLGFTPIGYVEWDDYRQRVLAARIADGFIPAAPIFGDVREFVQSGAAERYCGFVDVVTAGFPCQPFSGAGLMLGADDPRNMWPATRDAIRVVQPQHVMLENVSNLIVSGYFGTVIADLAAMGFVGRWGCIPAAGVGACHVRWRVFVVAHADEGMGQARSWNQPQPRERPRERGRYRKDAFYRESGWVETATEFLRMDDGLANPVDRTAAIGDGQVPRVVAAAWELLS
jgi:DNA (cytosine-5)-methyltransferase 1